MFVTLKEFFDNFRIRNGDKPNETVFNRPLFRLKREIRELKSVLDTMNVMSTFHTTAVFIVQRLTAM